jgi:hypothetical protein
MHNSGFPPPDLFTLTSALGEEFARCCIEGHVPDHIMQRHRGNTETP